MPCSRAMRSTAMRPLGWYLETRHHEPVSGTSTGPARILIDDRFFPLVITKWVGLAPMELVREHFADLDRLLQRAMDTRTRMVQVSDSLTAEAPPALTRKAISEMSDKQVERFSSVLLRPSYVAMDNILLRGTLIAINWVSRNAINIEPYATMPAALKAGLERMDREGLTRPVGLDVDRYTVPDPAGKKG
jgi:hypothetical protein